MSKRVKRGLAKVYNELKVRKRGSILKHNIKEFSIQSFSSANEENAYVLREPNSCSDKINANHMEQRVKDQYQRFGQT